MVLGGIASGKNGLIGEAKKVIENNTIGLIGGRVVSVRMPSPVEKDVLRVLLAEGAFTPSGIAKACGNVEGTEDRIPESISRALSRMEDDGIVVNKRDTGVWDLTAQGVRLAQSLNG